VRAFVAVFPPPEIRVAAVAGAREAVQRLGNRLDDRLRWIRPENVHLTLKFLSDIRDEILGDLCAALEEACARYEPFDVELAVLGAFPSARRARILWASIGTGSERLRSLAADIDDALVPLGFERKERSYTPHLTLGRVRGRPASFDLPSNTGGTEFRVRCVKLMESTLTQRGAVYETVRAFTLKEP
jgi:2'-5' RNA ligase